jgi:hypothetical protein
MRSRIASAFAIAIGAFVLYRFDPMTTRGFPQCVFHALTGLECPGCGTTRALHALLHGDVAAAWRFNASLFFSAPFMGVAIISPRFALRPATAWIAIIGTVGWWVGRNL